MAKNKVRTGTEMILIGGSAGSLQVVLQLLERLDANYPVPIVLVLHRDPQGVSRLGDLLDARSLLTVREVEDKDPIEAGHVYICPADYHLLIEQDHTFSLDYSEKVNFSRPSIDVSFRSAADALGPGLICILLSGANADGAEGLSHVKDRDGITVVQDPEDAKVSYMPEQAILYRKADKVLTTPAIIDFILAQR